MGQYSSGETHEITETPRITLDISIDREKYPYIHLKKSDLKKLGIKETGIYKLSLKINGEENTIYINIKKPKKQKINLPTKHRNKTKATITNIEKYNLEKIIQVINKHRREGYISYTIFQENNNYYLKIGKVTKEIKKMNLRVYQDIINIDMEVEAIPEKTLRLQIRIQDDKPELYYNIRGKHTYCKITKIKTAPDVTALIYKETKKGRKIDRHVYILPIEVSINMKKILDSLEIKGFKFLSRKGIFGHTFEVYKIVLESKTKLQIDAFLDYTYRIYFSTPTGDMANKEREKIGLIIAEEFLKRKGFSIESTLLNQEETRRGIDIIASDRENKIYFIEVKATEPSYLKHMINKALKEIKQQTYYLYKHEIDRMHAKEKYIGIIIVTYHYSWRYLNKYEIYFWVGKYEN